MQNQLRGQIDALTWVLKIIEQCAHEEGAEPDAVLVDTIKAQLADCEAQLCEALIHGAPRGGESC